MEKKIPIKVSGHTAYITRVVASNVVSRLSAIVELDPSVRGLLTFGVDIPAKEYTKIELVRIVMKGAEKSIQRHVARTEKEERERRNHERMKKLAEEVNKAVGLA